MSVDLEAAEKLARFYDKLDSPVVDMLMSLVAECRRLCDLVLEGDIVLRGTERERDDALVELETARRQLAEMLELQPSKTTLANEAAVLHCKIAIAREALAYVAESHRWGEDTAIKRTITDFQNTCSKALAKIDGREP